MNIRDLDVVGFSSEATAENVTIELGYVPAAVFLLANRNATNPDLYIWVNPDYASGQTDADGDDDDAIKVTGSTGVFTVVDDAIASHSGGTTITASNDENFRGLDGVQTDEDENPISRAGITIKSGIQTNSGYNILIAFRAAR